MILDINDKNLLLQSLSDQQSLNVIFYEILYTYSTKSFTNKENISLFNKILKINKSIFKIETDPENLLSKLESNLLSLDNNLKEINSLIKLYNIYNKANNNDQNNNQKIIQKRYDIFDNFIDKYMNCIFRSYNKVTFNSINILYGSNINNNNLIILEDNFFKKLIEKHLLIGKYFKLLKIQYNKKVKNNKEFIQIRIIFRNLFIISILLPFNLSKFNENDYDKKIKIIVNGIYGPSNTITYDNNYNNYSNYKFYKKLAIILNNTFKNILKIKNIQNIGKISFYQVFIIFLDYIYDYSKIFRIKCDKCLNKIKYIKEENYFSIPCYKIINYDDKYIKNLITNIEKENMTNNNIDKNVFKFFHEECINI